MLVLGLRSWYSLNRGYLSPADGVAAAKAAGATAVAWADVNELASFDEFMRACAEQDVTPIPGVEVSLRHKGSVKPLLLFATTPQSVKRLFETVAAAEPGEKGELIVEAKKGAFDDLLVCTGGLNGHFHDYLYQRDIVAAEGLVQSLRDAGGRVIIGVDPDTTLPYHLNSLKQFAGDRALMPYRQAIYQSAGDHYYYNDVSTIIGGEQTEAFLNYNPAVIRTSTQWAEHAAAADGFAFDPKWERSIISKYTGKGYGTQEITPGDIPYNGLSAEEAQVELRKRCTDSLVDFMDRASKANRATLSEEKQQGYRTRLEEELGVAEKMGVQKYLLHLADVIKIGKDASVPIGAGRGSSVNSLLCFLLKITEINPVREDLPFERFLNASRKTLPDIDIDVSRSLSKKFQSKVREHFPNSCYMRTFSGATLQQFLPAVLELKNVEKNTIKNCMGALKDKYARGGRFEGRTYDEMKEKFPEFERDFAQFSGCSPAMVQSVVGLLKRIGDRPSGSGIHASGVAICSVPFTDIVPMMPIMRGAEKAMAVALPFDQAEKKGIVKIDILSLDALDQMQQINRSLRKNGNPPIKANGNLLKEVHCKQVLDRGLVAGVFQLSRRADMVRDLKIRSFDDLVYTLGAIRVMAEGGDVKAKLDVMRTLPPPMGEVFGAITKKTRGQLIFQEQLSRALHDFSGMPRDQAEDIRKAISKKEDTALFGPGGVASNPDLQKGKDAFIAGCGEKFGLEPAKATTLFEAVCHSGKYLFNAGHSRAYARIAEFQIVAKCEYTCETFVEMLRTVRRENKGEGFKDNVAHLVYEARVLSAEVVGFNLQRNVFTTTIDEATPTTGHVSVHRKIGLGIDALATVDNAQCRALHDSIKQGSKLTPALLRSPAVKMAEEDVVKIIALGGFDFLEPDRAKLLGQTFPEYKGKGVKLPTIEQAQKEYLGFLTDEVHPGLQMKKVGNTVPLPVSKLDDMQPQNGRPVTLTGFLSEVSMPRRTKMARKPMATVTMNCYLGDEPARISRFFDTDEAAERFVQQSQQITPFTPVLLTAVANVKPDGKVFWNTYEDPVPALPDNITPYRDVVTAIGLAKAKALHDVLSAREPVAAGGGMGK